MMTVARWIAGLIAVTALVFVFSAHAAEFPIDWPQDPNATGSRVYLSTDAGQTWAVIDEQRAPPFTVTVGDSGLQLLRACDFNDMGEECRLEFAAAYNGDWKEQDSGLAAPANIKVGTQ